LAIKQVAALPYRIEADGSARILLITSRETKRWVVPKGNPIRGLQPHQSAAHEAFEEAGISGIACPVSIGAYHYDKRRANGTSRLARVELFPLAVITEFDNWPEMHERNKTWFSTQEAAGAVDEPELRALIGSFRQPPKTAGLAESALLWARNTGGERVPGLRWFQRLMPSQGRFFEQFEEHSQTLVAGADALARLFAGDESIAACCKVIHDEEHKADNVIREVLQDVRRTLITPFDRSAITSLIGVMDDAIDQMNATAKTITLYEVTEFEQQMRDMSGIIVEAARIAAEAVPLLRSIGTNANRLHALTERLVRIEGHADDIHDSGVKALFKRHGDTQPMSFVIGREIYGHLEKIVDRFEDVANEIQGLVIDHA
jgi:predicted phosphate transport protein (TIGR00153 family)